MKSVSVLIDFTAPRGGPPIQLALKDPVRVLQACELPQVRSVVDAAHEAARQGAWCTGYVRYEAAPAFDPAYRVREEAGAGQPLAWFAIFDQAHPLDRVPVGGYALGDGRGELEAADFAAGMARIAQAIRDGENYQINYTMRLSAPFSGDARGLFDALRRSQPHSYAAMIRTGGTDILSVSPELFFEWRDGCLVSRPMKGTAARGVTPQDDEAQAAHLRASEKERAENLMIVDLIRNDMSRIALPHSVKVPRLFETRAWPTVWQMTSDVTAASRPGTRLSEVFAALFPCGSVVGVPKVRAMQLIAGLEHSPRGVYCGAIGLLEPGGAATFNVAIRTLELDGGRAQWGVGSGVVSDSEPAAEWREWRDKWAFLRRAAQPFEILETIYLAQGRMPLQSAHLARMAQAARHFGYPWGPGQQAEAERLLGLQARQHAQGSWRVRLLLDARGQLGAEAVAQPPVAAPVRVQLASRALVDADSEFVRFKTTRRRHYEALAPQVPGVFDSLLWNERRELTEFTRGNVFLKVDGVWVTPPVACGLLPGVGRAQVLAQGLPPAAGPDAGAYVREAVVTLDDWPQVQALAFVNGCRGWLPAVCESGIP